MVNIRRQRLKAIRAGVNVKEANDCNSQTDLIEMMEKLPNIPKDLEDSDGTSE